MSITWAPQNCRFPQTQFRRIFTPIKRPVPTNAQVVTAFTDGVVTLRQNRRVEGFHEAADLSGYQGVEHGDFVVHGLDILKGSVGVSDSDGAISSVCSVCTPRIPGDPRFFAYAIRAQAYSGFTRALARGVREGGADFRRWDTLAELPLPCPSPDEQRRIADYLDAEVNRIDQVKGRLRHMVDLLKLRSRAVIDLELGPYGHSSIIPVSTCSAVLDCVNKTAPTTSEKTPYKMIRTSDIKEGWVDTFHTLRVSERTFNTWTRRSTPRRGDVLLTREAPLGEAGILETNESVFLGQRIVSYRANEEIIKPELLLFNMLSSRSDKQFHMLGAGSIHPHMRVSDALKLKIVCPPINEQDELVKRIWSARVRCFELRTNLDRQLMLLAERRQALITAAVTGQVDVTTASSVQST